MLPWSDGHVRAAAHEATGARRCGLRALGPVPLALALALLAGLVHGGAIAQGNERRDSSIEQREQRERIEQWRREQERRAPVLGAQAAQPWLPPLADEKPCFVVHRVEIVAPDGTEANRHVALSPLLGPVPFLPGFEGQCLGAVSLDRLRANLQDGLMTRGYITSVLLVMPQDLSSGTFMLQLAPGVVEAVAVEGARAGSRPAANALALQAGEVLNLRGIEQTLENLSRLPSQAARFVIEPGNTAGASLVRILPLQPDAPLWRALLGVEKADGRDYGNLQFNGQLSLDHVFGRSEQFGLWASHSQGEKRTDGARALQTSWYAYGNLPLGSHALTLSHSRADYRRFIAAGVGQFRDAGRDETTRLRWEWTFWRGTAGRMQLWAAAAQRRARTYLDDIELISRRRLGTSVEQGVSLWGRVQGCEISLDLEAAQVQRLERDAEFQPPTDGLPRSWRAGAQGSCALAAGYDFNAQTWVQRVAQPVDGSDLVVLGTPQTVRAHAASDSLSGRGQWVWRQELLLPPLQLGTAAALRPSLALDWGRVHHPVDGGRAGRELAAVSLGMRWQAGRVSGQLTGQHALNAPPSSGEASSQARRDARWQASVRISL